MDKSLFNRWFGSVASSPAPETTEALANRGDADAQFSLGLRYANSEGTAQNYAQAEHWYLKAAGQNHPLANFNLGMMHANGHGMPSDRVKALAAWIQKAADLGDAGAQYNLGASHHRSVMEGLSENAAQSRIDAYKWFHLAAVQGYRGAEVACEVVNLHMTSEDVAEGERRIAAFNLETSAAAKSAE